MDIAYVLGTWKRFNDEHVDVFIYADKTFPCFHEALLTIVVPKVPKRVVSAVKYNKKEGFTLMVSM